MPAGLANGTTAVAVAELDNVAYTGPTSGTKAELLTAIGTPSNWTGSDEDRPPLPIRPRPFDLSSQSIVPLIEI